ncbi:IucA/IucC family protein [Nocardioides marmoraquaticus]
MTTAPPDLSPRLLDHLTAERMQRAHRTQCAKTLAELSHERLLRPRLAAGDPASPEGADWELDADHPRVGYRFRARVLTGEHWIVRPASVRRVVAGEVEAPDALQLVLDLREALGLTDAVLPTYLEEVASTLAGRCRKDDPAAPTSAALVRASFQEVEAAMTEGHPCFVANNGRVGFDVVDVAAYAPEAGPLLRLQWLAAHRDHTRLTHVPGHDEATLYADELDAEVRSDFDRQLRDRGLDPADYLLLPCHPWQWRHKVAVTFAPEVAAGLLVPLGEGPDTYQPQQSIRTYFNRSRPERRYVKTALSVLNMGFMRGLSAAYMEATPLINEVVDGIVSGDPTLRAHGFAVLREVAAVGFRPPSQTAAGPSPYTKMLAALWRESPVDRVGPGERLASMTSLLHVDRDGVPLAAELVRASGLDPEEWVRTYLRAYLVPVVHALVAHGLVFMPHGENVVMVLRDHVPVRVLMKDIGEEVAICSPTTPVPAGAERMRADVPDEQLVLAVHGDVVDGFLRHLAGLLDDAGVLPATRFWAVAVEVLQEHRAGHPHLAPRLDELDLHAPEVPLMCLNRLQLRDNRQMVDLADPGSAVVLAGVLVNPLAG